MKKIYRHLAPTDDQRMTTGTLNTEPGESYYECSPCGYAAPAEVAIGLCPRCGERLVARTQGKT